MSQEESLVRRLADLVARGLEKTGQGPRAQITVAELHRRLVPYEDIRPELGVATKAEYDLTLLRFLHQEKWVEMEELALRRAVADELDAAEPGLGFLQNFSASPLRMNLSEAWGGRPRAKSAKEVAMNRYEEEGQETAAAEGASGAGSDAGAGEPAAAAGECRNCGQPLPERENLRYCPWCGSDQTVRECGSCGGELEAEWRYCPACGAEAPG